MACIVVMHFAGCFSADHLHENGAVIAIQDGAVIGIQDGAEDDSRKHWTVCQFVHSPNKFCGQSCDFRVRMATMKTDGYIEQLLSMLKKLTRTTVCALYMYNCFHSCEHDVSCSHSRWRRWRSRKTVQTYQRTRITWIFKSRSLKIMQIYIPPLSLQSKLVTDLIKFLQKKLCIVTIVTVLFFAYVFHMVVHKKILIVTWFFKFACYFIALFSLDANKYFATDSTLR